MRGRGLLEPGDAEEGLRAAAAIGDDRMQRQSQDHLEACGMFTSPT